MASAGIIGVAMFAITLLYMGVECYPHKRDVSSLSQVINLLSEEQHMQISQTHLLQNMTDAMALSVLTFPHIVRLLESYELHILNITATLQMLNAGNIVSSVEKLTKGFPITARDCSDISAQGPYRNGPYTITPWDEEGSFRAYCDMETDQGEGWTVFQRRVDGSVDFYRDWDAYKNGFGNTHGEHWLGLMKLNRLTSSGISWQLRVELEDFDGNRGYAQYDNFRIGNESTLFALTFDGYTGTAGDALTYHVNMPFSTKDRDNDPDSRNCAVTFKGAWWYDRCYYANLNGLYLGSAQVTPTGMVWRQFTGDTRETLKSSEMKIRPVP